MLKRIGGWVLAAMLTVSMAGVLDAAGGSNSGGGGGGGGGGGSVKTLEVRITGYITAINYETGAVTVGNSYYNVGTVTVTSTSKLSLDNGACVLDDLVVGDWAEVRYDWYTKVARVISALSL
jgi:hypothetical protein